MAFATLEDLTARWKPSPPLSESEIETAGILLEDAAIWLSAFVDVDAEDEQQAALLKMVNVEMVIRKMSSSRSDAFGVSQQTISADIYSQSTSWANPSGDFYLTRNEQRMLGITSSYLVNLRPTIDPVKVRQHDLWRDR